MGRKKILLVSPVFHGYWKAIQASLESLGYELTVHCYDLPHSVAGRIRNKIMHDIPAIRGGASLRDALASEAIQVLRNAAPDIVVIIKGDQLGPAWWDELDRSGVARVTWLYDEVRRTQYTWQQLETIGPVASYSFLDNVHLGTLGIESSHVPLAFDHRTAVTPVSSGAVTFIGARYPGRQQLLKGLHASGIPVEVVGKSWSRNPLDVLRTRQWTSSGIPARTDLTRTEAYGLMAGCPATINIHGDQDGFTMRTFEASGVGGLQIVDRGDVAAFYEPDAEIVTFNGPEELAEQARRAMVDLKWSERIRAAARHRTLSEHTFDHRVRQLEDLWA